VYRVDLYSYATWWGGLYFQTYANVWFEAGTTFSDYLITFDGSQTDVAHFKVATDIPQLSVSGHSVYFEAATNIDVLDTDSSSGFLYFHHNVSCTTLTASYATFIGLPDTYLFLNGNDTGSARSVFNGAYFEDINIIITELAEGDIVGGNTFRGNATLIVLGVLYIHNTGTQYLGQYSLWAIYGEALVNYTSSFLDISVITSTEPGGAIWVAGLWKHAYTTYLDINTGILFYACDSSILEFPISGSSAGYIDLEDDSEIHGTISVIFADKAAYDAVGTSGTRVMDWPSKTVGGVNVPIFGSLLFNVDRSCDELLCIPLGTICIDDLFGEAVFYKLGDYPSDCGFSFAPGSTIDDDICEAYPLNFPPGYGPSPAPGSASKIGSFFALLGVALYMLL